MKIRKIKKKFFIFLTLIILFSTTKSSYSQNNTHWHWVENDTFFNRSGISGLAPGSYAKYIDVDNDDQPEVVLLSRYGIQLYKRTENTECNTWILQPEYFRGISPMGNKGFEYIDLDHDGQLEFITAADHFYIWENSGTMQNPVWQWDSLMYRISFVPELDRYYLKFPELIDFDGDGDFDLCGSRQNPGEFSYKLMYYENVGSDSIPIWKADSTFFENFELGYGSIRPSFADIDNDGDFDLFYISQIEDVKYMQGYLNISKGDSVKWERFEFPAPHQDFQYFFVYAYDWYDLDSDQDLDLLITNGSLSLLYFENIGTPTTMRFNEFPETWGDFDSGRDSQPILYDFNNDDDFDLTLIGFQGGFIDDYLIIHGYEQTGDGWKETNWLNLDPFQYLKSWFISYTTLSFNDFDEDNDKDIFVYTASGDENSGGVDYIFFRNTASDTAFQFEIDREYMDTLRTFRREALPVFGDLDGDGDFDMMASINRRAHFYENIGNNKKYSIREREDWASGDSIIVYRGANFADIDLDNDNDLILGNEYGILTCYINKGTAYQPFWQKDTSVFAGIRVEGKPSPVFIDFDDDGDLDFTSGNTLGGIQYFENKSYTSVDSELPNLARRFRLFQNFPNPFNASTVIKYEISEPNQPMELIIFNVRGERVRTLVNSHQSQGVHVVRWDAKDDAGFDMSSGPYFCKIQTSVYSDTRKLLLVR